MVGLLCGEREREKKKLVEIAVMAAATGRLTLHEGEEEEKSLDWIISVFQHCEYCVIYTHVCVCVYITLVTAWNGGKWIRNF